MTGDSLHTTAPSELVAGCLAGEQAAWDELVDRYTPLVFAIARSHRLSVADCEDVVQAAWLRVIRHLSELRSPDRLVQGIAAAARQESLKHLERSGRRLPAGSRRTPADRTPAVATIRASAHRAPSGTTRCCAPSAGCRSAARRCWVCWWPTR
ncbi:RNA polymerase sigma factor [Kitasatospora aburaviensis]